MLKNDAGNVQSHRFSIVVIVILFVIVLSFITFSFLQSRKSSKPISLTATRTQVSPTSEPNIDIETTSSAAPLPVSTIVVSDKNGTDSDQELLVTLAIDKAMSALLNEPFSEQDSQERLDNTKLVLQSAVERNYSVSEDKVEQFLHLFLINNSITREELERALSVEGITFEQFTDYFQRLVLVDLFSQEQAQAQGITVSEYLQRLAEASQSRNNSATEIALATVPITITNHTFTPTLIVNSSPTITPTPIIDASQYASKNDVQLSNTAPWYELDALNNPSQERMTSADVLGRPTVLSFWTTWCPHCLRQTPVLVNAYNIYPKDEINFIGINVKEDIERVKSYIAENKIEYPVLLDTTGLIAGQYEVTGYPTTFFLNKNGQIVSVYTGELSADQLDLFIQQIY